MRHTFIVVTVKKRLKWVLYAFTEVITKLNQAYHFLDQSV